MIKRTKKVWKRRLGYALGFFGLAWVGVATTMTDDFEIAKNLEIYSNLYRELNTYYVGDIDSKKLMESGMKAMLSSLDPYTTYIPAEEVARFKSFLSGNYGGVGAFVTRRSDYVEIVEVHRGGAAAESGLRAGDLVLAADGQSMKGKSIQELVTIMRGIPGTEVNVEVERAGKRIQSVLTRKEIQVPSVPYKALLDSDIAYIVLSSFSEKSAQELANALSDFKRETKITGVILDLRGNLGGLLSQAIEVANVFLNKGEMIVQVKGKNKAENQALYTTNIPVDAEVPLVVLIDSHSASASEIVAGAIQDLDRGVILGSRSFGKGLVQSTRDLSHGAKLKLTVARYYVPSGRCIQSSKYQDGKPVQLVDSLQVAFKTKAGRTVYGGGGILPDVESEWLSFKAVENSLTEQFLLFDFATQYHLQHDTIDAPEVFQLKDEDFEDFIAFIKNKEYNFSTDTESALKFLSSTAKKEAYAVAIKDEMAELDRLMDDHKERLLRRYKERILQLLQKEITQRYYFREGGINNNMRMDKDIQKARELIRNRTDYQKILQQKDEK